MDAVCIIRIDLIFKRCRDKYGGLQFQQLGISDVGNARSVVILEQLACADKLQNLRDIQAVLAIHTAGYIADCDNLHALLME